MFDGSLVCNVCLVPCQSNYYVGTGLSLQLLHPVFCTGKSVLIKTITVKKKRSHKIMCNLIVCFNSRTYTLLCKAIPLDHFIYISLQLKNNTILLNKLWKQN